MKDKDVIVAFDFDGTITTKDTLFDFLTFYYGRNKLMLGLIVLFPFLFAYKIGLLNNSVVKEKLISYFFRGEEIKKFTLKCEAYAERISQIYKDETLDKIKWHTQQGHKLVIVSASMMNWIQPWAISFGFYKVIATELEVIDNKLTGKFASKNCYGQEKVNRLLNEFPDRKNYILYAYGDSNGDKQMLELSDYPTLIK